MGFLHLLRFTRVIVLQYARSGTILPGMMNTPMIHAAVIAAYGRSAEEMVRRHDAQCPMGHMGDAWMSRTRCCFPAPSWLLMAGCRSTASEHRLRLRPLSIFESMRFDWPE